MQYNNYQTQKGRCKLFKRAIIYYPKDEKILRQIQKDIAVFHCNAAMKYLDSLGLNNYQKSAVIQEVLKNINYKPPTDKKPEKD